ncbi:unnamed protein product [Rotaria magnacalcarata]|uniref:EF-hand domain-containing protein n=1 Tax=Rotaria magnacalcarata TaxID=392030 RepID=A0A816WS70_9BILA|nr:unnamed protein product [Rotaria magnacalcarata]CAF1505514.1 unnamed protein product [Rotaria magnacalcarata]CAF2010615.1 unnamed protein product [Rotaria magnacalcarata]CAF2097527.1 unnamed protein product [Rotaria magnacalcarata]CAF2138008.1 unnamed protein product [Rotaria magnacalcarata]
MNLEFTVTEAIVHNLGVINEIRYEFTVEYVSVGITNKKEKRSRTYDTNITREQYNKLAEQYHYGLSFDNFIVVLRPFMMGFYQTNELEQAFRILDKSNSGSIDIDNLANFLPIINEYATSDTLKNYIKKSDFNHDGNLTYDEFRSLILRGIGREMICTNI